MDVGSVYQTKGMYKMSLNKIQKDGISKKDAWYVCKKVSEVS